jgi:membrane peptidoglycan carboxypeptidase
MKRLWHFWKRRRRRQKSALVLLFLLLIAAGAVYQWIFAGLPGLDNLEAGMALPSTRIYDRQGRLLYQIADPKTGVNQVIPLEDIPDCMVQATIATEDANFYSHPGVDIEGITRALWINVKGGEVVAGGSTITQQVVRNLLFDPEQRAERTLRRKLRESVLAVELTRRYSRDEILALYLNQTYYGNLAYGIEAAARAYFGKGASELALAECAMLAGLPQAPASYDPLSSPEAAKDRQRVARSDGQWYISQAQADQPAKKNRVCSGAVPD